MNHLSVKSPDMRLVGIGLYTVSEAEKLIRVPAARIRRWLTGQAYQKDGISCWFAPLWEPQIPRFGKEIELGFRDLLELRLVDAFIRQGVSLQAVRKALAVAQDIIGIDHPFATARFLTDGRSIFLKVAETVAGDEEPQLVDLLRRQYAFNRMVEPSLRDLDFDEGGLALRWWPLSRAKSVVLDPAIQFGHPTIAGVGITTRALADAVTAEGGIDPVARLYEISAKQVRDALLFEERLAA